MYIGAPRFSRVTNSLLRTVRDTPRGLRRSGLPSRTLTHCKYEATHRPEFLEEAAQAASSQLHRFYVNTLPEASGCAVQLDADESRHATKALRLGEGDEVQLCDGRGGLVSGIITAVGRRALTIEASHTPSQSPWFGPRWEVAAGFGLLKGSRADWLVEKCSELGAHSVRPLVSQRVHAAGAGWKVDSNPSKHKDDSASGRQARFRRVAVAATKQSLRSHELIVHPSTPFVDLLPRVAAQNVALLAVAGAPECLAGNRVTDRLSSLRDGDSAMLLIGPEGDFTLEEISQLLECGALPVGLGSLRLRVETAAIGLLATATAYQRAHSSVPTK